MVKQGCFNMSSSTRGRKGKKRSSSKEGFMEKRTGFIQMWKSRYFVLMNDVLCYFKSENDKDSLTPTGRIFFSDIVSVDKFSSKKNRPFCILVTTEGKKHLMSCVSEKERDSWINSILSGIKDHKHQEASDPVRRKSCRLGKDMKRVTIQKDVNHGIGCTIKNVGGAIYVSRIIPEGPVAVSGVLRPGDQVIEINGQKVSGCPIEQIKGIIKESPDYVVCTVKPVTHYSNKEESPSMARSAYTEVDPSFLEALSGDEDGPQNGDVIPQYANVEIGGMRRKAHTYERSKSSSVENLNYLDESDLVLPKSLSDDNVAGEGTIRQYAELDFGKR